MMSCQSEFYINVANCSFTVSGWVESVWDQDSVTSYVKNMSRRMRWCNTEW